MPLSLFLYIPQSCCLVVLFSLPRPLDPALNLSFSLSLSLSLPLSLYIYRSLYIHVSSPLFLSFLSLSLSLYISFSVSLSLSPAFTAARQRVKAARQFLGWSPTLSNNPLAARKQPHGLVAHSHSKQKATTTKHADKRHRGLPEFPLPPPAYHVCW